MEVLQSVPSAVMTMGDNICGQAAAPALQALFPNQYKQQWGQMPRYA